MSATQLANLKEAVVYYNYIAMRVEMLEAALAFLCLTCDSMDEVMLAHGCLYTGLWVDTPPEEPKLQFLSRAAKGLN